MKKVYLHGILGEKLGHIWELAVSSVAEAIKAIECNTGGKLSIEMAKLGDDGGKYNIVIGKESFQDETEILIRQPSSIEEFHIVPVLETGNNTMKIIVGIVLIAAAWWIGWGMAAPLIKGVEGLTLGGAMTMATLNIGISLVLGGLMGMIMGSPDLKSQSSSFTFDSEVNVSRQGTPLGLVYGEYMCGSNICNFFQYSREEDEIGAGDRQLDPVTAAIERKTSDALAAARILLP